MSQEPTINMQGLRRKRGTEVALKLQARVLTRTAANIALWCRSTP